MATRLGTGGKVIILRPKESKEEVVVAWTFCPTCAARTDWARTCSQCGARIPTFDLANAVKSDGASEADQAEERTRGRWLDYAGMLLLMFVIFGILAGLILLPGWIS